VLDPSARIPLAAKVLSDPFAADTTVVVTNAAPARRAAALARRVRVLRAPERAGGIDLRWLLRELGRQEVTSLLVEGGGETHATFLSQGLAGRVMFSYAPLVLGGRAARKAVAGRGAGRMAQAIGLAGAQWRRAGADIVLTARLPESARKDRYVHWHR
jgi:diaminohydroxyphosphoribosylaminopyrimidine deaminase/5-amino-6-(5-phosphoribosylamino)uracil reductase